VPVVRGVDFSSPLLAGRHLTADIRRFRRGIELTDDLKDVHTNFAEQNALRGTGYDEDDVDALLEEDDSPYSRQV
jgi:hypothetical protein